MDDPALSYRPSWRNADSCRTWLTYLEVMNSTLMASSAATPAVVHTFTCSPDTASALAPVSPDSTLASPASLEALQWCTSISGLRVALGVLCRAYGDLRRLDIVPAAQGGRQQALCFLRLQTAAQEESLMRALGIGRFGGELVLVVKLASPEWHH